MHDPLRAPTLTRGGWILDVVFGIVLATPGILALETTSSESIAFISFGVAFALRQLAPSIMIVVAIAAVAIQVVTLEVSVYASLILGPLVFTCAAHRDSRVRSGALVAVGVLAVTAALIIPISPTVHTGTNFAPVVIGLACGLLALLYLLVAWSIGFISFQRRIAEQAHITARIAELERRRAVDQREHEAIRLRIARDMHDVVAHSLAVVIAQAEGARYVFDAAPERARDSLGVIAQTSRSALVDVRTLLHQLRDTGTEVPFSFGSELYDDLFTRMRAAGLRIEIDERGDRESVTPMTAATAYRVVTEALTNALRHGDTAMPVHVALDWSNGVEILVRNRIAQRREHDHPPKGHGVDGMIERAAMAGGTLLSYPESSGDWLVRLRLPAVVSP